MYKTTALLTNKKTVVFESRVKRQKGDHVIGYVFDSPLKTWGGIIDTIVHVKVSK